jgi:hypothetical protein
MENPREASPLRQWAGVSHKRVTALLDRRVGSECFRSFIYDEVVQSDQVSFDLIGLRD